MGTKKGLIVVDTNANRVVEYIRSEKKLLGELCVNSETNTCTNLIFIVPIQEFTLWYLVVVSIVEFLWFSTHHVLLYGNVSCLAVEGVFT